MTYLIITIVPIAVLILVGGVFPLIRSRRDAVYGAVLAGQVCQMWARTGGADISNSDLQKMFGLNPTNFNHQVYWLTLHSWMLHQRFLVEKLNKLESEYVDRIWLMPYKWMMEKGVPRHRLQVELEHAHRYSLKLSVELDQAISRPDILPGQIGEVIWRTVFSEDAVVKSPNDPRIVLLSKYLIRNLNFVLNSVPKDHFTQGAFIWPGMLFASS